MNSAASVVYKLTKTLRHNVSILTSSTDRICELTRSTQSVRVFGSHEEHVVSIRLEPSHNITLFSGRVGSHHPPLLRLVTEVLHPVRLHGRCSVVGAGFPRQQHRRLVDELDVGAGGRTWEGGRFWSSMEDDVGVGVGCKQNTN